MKTVQKFFTGLLLVNVVFIVSCDQQIDDVKPGIDLGGAAAFPQQCDTIWYGEPFVFSALFSDNMELGSYSIDIHNNFDHHSHTTEVDVCGFGEEKEPVNPFQFTEEYEIPAGLTEWDPRQELTFPVSDGEGMFDAGDYHFMIRVTDHEGWSAQKGLSIKILHRE